MQKKNIVLLCLIEFLQGMVFYAAVATLYRQEAGLGIFEIMVIESANMALSMLLEVPWGWLADRIGYRKTMIVCNVLFLVTKFIFWQTGSFGGFLAERLLLAVVISGLSGVSSSMLWLSAPPEKAQRNAGWCSAAGEAGLLLSGMLYTVMLSGQYRAAAFWTMVVYGIAAVLTFFLAEVRPEEELHRKRSFRSLAREHFRAPGMIALVLCGAFFFEVVHQVTVYFNQLQYLRCGLSDKMIGIAFIAVSVTGLAGPLSTRVTKRFGSRRTGKGLILLAALCMGVLVFTTSGILSIALIVLVALLSALFGPLAGTLENEMVVVKDRATALSLNAIITDSLVILLDMGIARAADASLPLALGLCCAGCLAALAAFTVSCRKAAK